MLKDQRFSEALGGRKTGVLKPFALSDESLIGQKTTQEWYCLISQILVIDGVDNPPSYSIC